MHVVMTHKICVLGGMLRCYHAAAAMLDCMNSSFIIHHDTLIHDPIPKLVHGHCRIAATVKCISDVHCRAQIPFASSQLKL